jgi:hypothetical protein
MRPYPPLSATPHGVPWEVDGDHGDHIVSEADPEKPAQARAIEAVMMKYFEIATGSG